MDIMNRQHNQIKSASLMSYVIMILQILTSILTTPYIVNRIGDASYGVYKVIASFVAYMTVLNFGLGTAALRYLSEYRINNNKEKETQLLSFINIANYIISFIVIIIGAVIYIYIPNIFGKSMSKYEIDLARQLFVVLLVNIVISVFTDKYVGIINAYEQFIYVKLIDLIRTCSKIILIYAILYINNSALSLTLIDLFLNLFVLILYKIFCQKKLGITYANIFQIANIKIAEYKEFILYAGGVFITMIINQLLWNVDSVIIGMRLGAIESAIYAVGTTFSSAFFSASIIFTNMLLPKVVKMTENGATGSEYTQFAIKIARYQSYIILYIYFAFVVFGQNFIELWMGNGYKGAWTTALLVMSGTLFSSFVITVQVILRAQKRQSFYNIVHLAIFIFNAILTYYAVGFIGIDGAALMTFFTYLFGYVFIIYPYYYYKIKIDIFSIFKALLKWCIPCASLIAVLFWAIVKNITNTWINFTIEVILYTVVYILLMYITMNNDEKGFIINEIDKRKKNNG